MHGNLHRTSRARQARAAAGLVATLLAACAPAAEAPRAEDPPLPPAEGAAAPAPSTVPGAERPEVVRGTLSLEGSEEPMTFRLHRSPPGWPLPFSTYVPDDMVAEEARAGEGDAVRFVAAFGGTRDERAYLSVAFPPADLSRSQASERVRLVAESLGAARAEGAGERYPWAMEGYAFRGEGAAVGSVTLGSHAGRYFYVIVHHPAEYADGMGPRVAHILEEWRWGTTGEGM